MLYTNSTETIILCAGNINYLHFPMATNTSNAMVPVNGKPVISWILEDLISKDIKSITIVLRSEDQKLNDFISQVYESKTNIKKVVIYKSLSILDSLSQGMESIDVKKVRVVLGDTMIRESRTVEENFIYVSEMPDSHRWCVAQVDNDGIIKKYWDKMYNVPQPYLAVCGYYMFTDAVLVKRLLVSCLEQDKSQMSDLLIAYQEFYPVKGIITKHWLDFGNIDNLISAKQNLLQSRYFNSLTIDPILNTITKISEFDEKLRQELSWYETIPEQLKVLTPRIISKEQINGRLHFTQEYYGYPNLAELYLFSDLNLDNWESIIRNLFAIHNKLKSYTSTIKVSHLENIYWGKTTKRLEEWKLENESWKQLLNYSNHIKINGRQYLNFPQLNSYLKIKCQELSTNTKATIIHGDYCFGNILYDISGQIVRLIDPRGSFGKEGIYGDPRYDMAKLRHSINGMYDFIIGDLFYLAKNDSFDFQFHLPFGKRYDTLKDIFDAYLKNSGYSVLEIQLIEALLFLSMLPLHRDKPDRQIAMYLTGIIKINELYENSSRS